MAAVERETTCAFEGNDSDKFSVPLGDRDEPGTVRGFLHHMVRNLVGTFLLVGKGTLNSSGVRAILEKKSRSTAGATAPAEGLYLVNVEY